MSQIFMITAPRDQVHKRAIKEFIKNHDIHKWIFAKETGAGGYEHWQIRLSTSASFEEVQGAFYPGHIEESTEWGQYERKEGKFVCSEDTTDILRCRYGKLRKNQRRILREVYRQSDRGITVVYDPNGNTGKSFLCRWLYENGRGYYVPPTIRTTQGIIQHVASGYRGEGIITIDIPRSGKWTDELYEGIEAIKDGLVYETRYHPVTKDYWGVKVLCLTNTKPNLDALSADRWTILDSSGVQLKTTSYATQRQQKDAKNAICTKKRAKRGRTLSEDSFNVTLAESPLIL